MSTKDQVLSSELDGEALLTARRPELQPLIDHLREVAQGRDDIRVECAGLLRAPGSPASVSEARTLSLPGTAADPFGLLDDAVEAFGAGVGGVLGEGDQDGWPPRLDGFGQRGGFGGWASIAAS